MTCVDVDKFLRDFEAKFQDSEVDENVHGLVVADQSMSL
jgi:hypothetical protein